MELLIKRKNRTVAIIVAVLLLVSAVSGIFYVLNNNKSIAAEAQEPFNNSNAGNERSG